MQCARARVCVGVCVCACMCVCVCACVRECVEYREVPGPLAGGYLG